jgi:diguanylate cyclase (GGDEF)-like protein
MQDATIPDACALNLLRLREDSPVLIGLYDPREVLRYANRAFRQAYGIAPGEVIAWVDIMRRNYANGEGARIETDDIESWLASVRSRRGKQAYRSFEVDLCDGRWFWFTQTQDTQGWMLCVSSDISVLRTGERGLRLERDVATRAAQTDVLTGISNRAHIIQQLGARLELLRLERKSCGLVMMDLDHFKAVNDAYGHHNGDLVLKHFTATVMGSLRRLDGFGRMGGEEFMLLLPDTQPDQMESIIERILRLVRQSRPLEEHPEFSYTFSARMLMLRPYGPWVVTRSGWHGDRWRKPAGQSSRLPADDHTSWQRPWSLDPVGQPAPSASAGGRHHAWPIH